MSDMLRTKQEKMETAYEIMESLQNMFEQLSKQQCHEVVKALMNAKIKSGTPVQKHVIKMVNYINEAKVNKTMIEEATQVGMIVETLFPNFLLFKSNYFMNKLKYNMTELLDKLQNFESISKEKHAEVNVAQAQSSLKKKKK
ncbi:uncharacterized protein LOC132803779 [Ziziphus jujuba]|uniref:Uncharacterized protein LOC132803779 n=1 Tax=Ziziphus jujuba TaxID=326968 RepID=A0ABM4A982_ZIZJJ|nr:uncharacterized protein LOC132803779 [Ziziphus jujuba]